MLLSRKLDDQSYEDIVEHAVARLPWLCPVWTDHNAHDPGITVLELMAWYKETIQFQMDRVTPALWERLLALAGVELERERGAVCALEIGSEEPPREVLSLLTTPENVCFELIEPVPASRPVLKKISVELGDGGGRADISGFFTDGEAAAGAASPLGAGNGKLEFEPFSFGGSASSALLLGFSQVADCPLRLWFDVVPPSGIQRTPPDAEAMPPRGLHWEYSGAGAVEPLEDRTWVLSWSGFVTLPRERNWARGEDGLYWLKISQTDPGCEETVRLRGVSASRYLARQQETRAISDSFCAERKKNYRLEITRFRAGSAESAVFVRTAEGWEQTGDYGLERSGSLLRITLDTSAAVQDGENNLLVASLDPLRVRDLLFDVVGRPGEELRLNLEEKSVLRSGFRLMCLTLCPDGKTRPDLWKCVEELSLYGPRDRVFVYDRDRETVRFGDGRHGALPAAGKGAAMVIDAAVSLCSEGNVPANAGLRFVSDGAPAVNLAAAGGRERETLEEGRARLLRRLRNTKKCLCAEDFAARAKETPGFRVAGARAIPDYDAENPGQRVQGCVTVAVFPAGTQQAEAALPRADNRFLEAVAKHLEQCRSVCIRTKVTSVRYVPFALSASVRVERPAREEQLRQAITACFTVREERIGAEGDRDALSALLQKQPGVLQVRKLSLRGLDQNSYQSPGGDLRVAPDAMLILERMELELSFS